MPRRRSDQSASSPELKLRDLASPLHQRRREAIFRALSDWTARLGVGAQIYSRVPSRQFVAISCLASARFASISAEERHLRFPFSS